MKVVLLGDARSIHLVKWANGLASRNLEVYVISLHKNYQHLDNKVDLIILHQNDPLGYILGYKKVRKLLKAIKPDVLNVHYASGYGLLARLANYKPYILSVWGSDIYEFPNKSRIHKNILKQNLNNATILASTSKCMAKEVRLICPDSNIYITPFGIDEKLFSPNKLPKSDENEIIIGTVKTLENKYGIDILISAFARVWKELGKKPNIYLEITGEGEDLSSLNRLANELSISKQVTFHGKVSNEKVPEMLNRIDIFCAFSRFESFGVSILEASACELPVIVSDADGPSEVVLHGKTGFVVPKDNIDMAAIMIKKLIIDKKLRKRMGASGRKHVLENYTWDISLKKMISVYNKLQSLSSI